MVAEDSLDEKNSSNDDNDLEAGTKFDATQGNLLRGIDNKTVKDREFQFFGNLFYDFELK